MSILGDKLRKARESVCEADGHKFIVRRPTDLQLATWAKQGDEEFLQRCVVSYRGPAEKHICTNDRLTGEPIFDPDAFAQWIGDEPPLLNKLLEHILKQSEARGKAAQAQEKKS